MEIRCMYDDCNALLGHRGDEAGETSGICETCLDTHWPNEAAKVRAYRTCAGCERKSIKCQMVACDELSAVLDEIDQRLRQEGK